MVRKWLVIAAALTMVVGCSAEEPQAEPNSPEVDAGPDAEDEGDADTEGEDADAEDAPDAESDANEPGTEHGFQPRMVLYDGDGEPVEAVVSATSGMFSNGFQVGDVVDLENPDARCASVFIQAPSGVPEQLTMRLGDGDVAGCYASTLSNVVYPSNDCSGAPHINPVFTTPLKIDGVIMRPAGQVVEIEPYSFFVEGECVERPLSTQMVPLAPVPEWMTNAFPNPPYEVRLEF